jgi:pimeloyl-ACP methyl ester carboxylesterase
MGAMTIAAWAHEHEEEAARRLAGVALVGTGMGDLITESLVVRAPARLGSIKEWIETAAISTEVPFDGAPELGLQAAVRHLAFGPDARAEDVALVARMVRACPRRVRGQSGGTLSRMEVFDGLANLDAPAVVIAGAADRMTPPVHSRKLASLLPRSPDVIEVPRMGHMVPLEAAETVTAELRGLLQGARTSNRPRATSAKA